MKKLSLLQLISVRARLIRSKFFDKTVRFYIGNLKDFYADLDAARISYLILRWDDEVPLNGEAYRFDIDHLIEAGCLEIVARVAAKYPGRYKCDWYSESGERGGAYRGMPYYTPALAGELLKSRLRNREGLWVPAAPQKLRSFLYHLVYHKGLESGLAFEASDPTCKQLSTERDYTGEAKRLAVASGDLLPQHLCLHSVYHWLKREGWDMPEDALQHWSERSVVIERIEQEVRERLKHVLAKCSGLHVFLLRSDALDPQLLPLIRGMISDFFVIKKEAFLNPDESERLIRKTRGGNWVERGFGCAKPWYYFIARVRYDVPPFQHNFSVKKLRQRYPQIEHPNILVKRLIRDRVTELPGVRRKATVVHATDNAFETAITLEVIFGSQLQSFITTCFKSNVTIGDKVEMS